jgi:hypothetical protein
VKRIGILLLLAAALAGCGESDEAAAPAPPTLAGGALPDLESRTRTLDAEAVADDSLEPEQLAAVLDDASFQRGSEREFFGKTKTFDHVVARILRFADAEGADRYLGWFGEHPDDFLGTSGPAEVETPGDSGVVFRLVPCGSCKKELPTFLAGWRHGAVVATLLASGSGANEERFAALARELDEAVG